MEIGVNVRKLKLHLVFVVLVGMLGALTFWLIKNRWDEPWLKPAPKNRIVLAVRIDGFVDGDPQFRALHDAALDPFMPAVGVHPYDKAFDPEDMGSDSRTWPGRYSWVRVYCVRKRLEEVTEAAIAYDRDLQAAFKKTGIPVVWQLAVINEDGEVFRPR